MQYIQGILRADGKSATASEEQSSLLSQQLATLQSQMLDISRETDDDYSAVDPRTKLRLVEKQLTVQNNCLELVREISSLWQNARLELLNKEKECLHLQEQLQSKGKAHDVRGAKAERSENADPNVPNHASQRKRSSNRLSARKPFSPLKPRNMALKLQKPRLASPNRDIDICEDGPASSIALKLQNFINERDANNIKKYLLSLESDDFKDTLPWLGTSQAGKENIEFVMSTLQDLYPIVKLREGTTST